MPYIDQDYYLDQYKGKPITDPNELDRTILRASDAIDILTNYKINMETAHPFIVGQVKKATAALVEHYVLTGGYDESIQPDLFNVSVGTFSYSIGNQEQGASTRIPDLVNNLLANTGLLYAGLHQKHSEWDLRPWV